MNAIVRKGWCPSLYQPMASGDGWLVRVKPPRSTLTTEQARQLAVAADRFGNGAIELTNRAALQIRGLAADAVAPFAAAIVSAGLASPDPEVERRRTVILAPLAGDRATAIAAGIERLLTRDPRLAALPPKFAVSVDVGDIGADIRLHCTGSAIRIALAGAPLAATVDAAEAPDAIRALALAFLRLGGERRMRALVATLGSRSLFEMAGLGSFETTTSNYPARAIGWRDGAFGVGQPFGATTAAALGALADLADRHGDGTLRITPWRAVILPGIAEADASTLAVSVDARGMIADPADPRLAITACTGMPGCASATVDTRADAGRLAALALPFPLHVSGCAKGCAHVAAAPVTLVGAAGVYGLVRNGRAADPPDIDGLTIEDAVAYLRNERV